MDYGAIDLHKKESQIRIVTEAGKVIDRRITTTRERFGNVFVGRPRMRILLEASTESEWVAQHLEHMGHEVIVADPTMRRCTATGPGASRPIGVTSPRSPKPAKEEHTAPLIVDRPISMPSSVSSMSASDASPDASDLRRAGDHARGGLPHPQRSPRRFSRWPPSTCRTT